MPTVFPLPASPGVLALPGWQDVWYALRVFWPDLVLLVLVGLLVWACFVFAERSRQRWVRQVLFLPTYVASLAVLALVLKSDAVTRYLSQRVVAAKVADDMRPWMQPGESYALLQNDPLELSADALDLARRGMRDVLRAELSNGTAAPPDLSHLADSIDQRRRYPADSSAVASLSGRVRVAQASAYSSTICLYVDVIDFFLGEQTLGVGAGSNGALVARPERQGGFACFALVHEVFHMSNEAGGIVPLDQAVGGQADDPDHIGLTGWAAWLARAHAPVVFAGQPGAVAGACDFHEFTTRELLDPRTDMGAEYERLRNQGTYLRIPCGPPEWGPCHPDGACGRCGKL